jgi:hypothetical protein
VPVDRSVVREERVGDAAESLACVCVVDAIGSSERLPLVITRASPKSFRSRWCSGV